MPTAAVLVLEPIFEADLQPEQDACRRGKRALDAVRHVHALLNSGHTDVADADLSGDFDTIPHAELMKSVARRVSDKHRRGRIGGTGEFVLMLTMKNESPRHFDRPCRLHLIKMWLVAPTKEIDERGHRYRTTRNKDEKRGTPQGRRGRFTEDAVSVERLRTDGNSLGESKPPRGPISPLLSSLSLRRFLLGGKVQGHEQRLNARLVNDADDFVICCRGPAGEAMAAMRRLMSTLKLTVNETKTRQCRVPQESFDFLGDTIGRCYAPKTGRASIGTRPSKRKVQSLHQQLSEITSRRWLLKDASDRVSLLNRKR